MLVTFLTFAAIVAILLVGLLVYVKRGSENLTTVPGLEPSHPEDGNLKEIVEAGGFPPFLQNLHAEFGPVVSFWYGKEYHVSVGGSKALKDITPLFDRPQGLFQMAVPLLGYHSIQTTNGSEGAKRHKFYSNSINSANVAEIVPNLVKICREFADEWEGRPKDQHLLMRDEMISLALKMLFKTQLGSANISDKDIKMIDKLYKESNDQMVAIMNGDKSGERHQVWDGKVKRLHSYLSEKLDSYRKAKESGDYERAPLIEAIIEYNWDKPKEGISQELGDMTAFTVGGFHTTGLTLFWFFYYMSLHPDIQEEVYQELMEVLGSNEPGKDTIPELKFTRQVIDETLRCSAVGPFAARYGHTEITVGGHKIPPGMPIVVALCAALRDPEVFPDPEKFDPSRHGEDKAKKRPGWAFNPFGYGQRRCPGYYFTHAEMIVAVSMLVRRFKVSAVDADELKNLGRLHSIITGPDRDVWFTIEKR